MAVLEKTVLYVYVVAVIFCVSAQVHYVPAHIRIPALNASTVHKLQNATLNNSQHVDNTGWNNPLLNKTGATWNTSTPNGDLIVGKIGHMDHRLFNQHYFEGRRWWSGKEKQVRYPNDLPGSYGRHETISAVRVFNQYYDMPYSKAEILDGGVGKRFVKIKLSSKFGTGFKYLVQIYGH